MLTNISIFLELFHLVGRCPVCSGQIDVTVDFTAKKGLAQKVKLNCTGTSDCDWTYSSYLSTSVTSDERSRFDLNIISLIAYREIGRGFTHIETFNRVMNMPPPYSHSNYDETLKELFSPYEDAMNESMLQAAENVKS